MLFPASELGFWISFLRSSRLQSCMRSGGDHGPLASCYGCEGQTLCRSRCIRYAPSHYFPLLPLLQPWFDRGLACISRTIDSDVLRLDNLRLLKCRCCSLVRTGSSMQHGSVQLSVQGDPGGDTSLSLPRSIQTARRPPPLSSSHDPAAFSEDPCFCQASRLQHFAAASQIPLPLVIATSSSLVSLLVSNARKRHPPSTLVVGR